MTFKRILTVCAVLALAATSAFADIAYIGNVPGNQDWTGPLGMDFDVNSPITINYMGVFANGATTLNSVLQVEIFTTTGEPVLGTYADFATGTSYIQLPGDQFDLFQAITPVTLAPGAYSVVAVGFNGSQMNGNQGNGGESGATEGITDGSITYVGSGRYDYAAGLHLPDVIDGGPANRYDAGTFATPEPSFYEVSGVLGASMAGLLFIVRRRKAVR